MTTDTYGSTNIDYINTTKHYLYPTWSSIKRRCSNPECKAFKNYGGIGIAMYPEWFEDTASFLMWIDENLRTKTRYIFTG